MRKAFGIFGAITILFSSFSVLPAVVYGKTVVKAAPSISPSPTPTSTPSTTVEDVNSFDLFWPVVAGKTSDESLYFLKTLKEKIRGMLIFGVPQKADYSVLLATKRILEAEKLLNESKGDAASSTLDAALSKLTQAESLTASAKQANTSLADVSGNMSPRLNNITKFANWLSLKYPNYKSTLEKISEKAASVSSSL